MSLLESLKNFYLDTKAEIPTFALLGALTLGVNSYLTQVKKEHQAPIIRSEISESISESQQNHTLYFAAVNNVSMDIAQAKNEAYYEAGDSHINFANRIYRKLHPLVLESSFADSVAQIKSSGSALKTQLFDSLNAGYVAQAVAITADNTWDDRHSDNYIQVPVTTTSTDSKGNTTTSTTYVQQYVDTTHTYIYHPEHGNNLSVVLQQFESMPRQHLEGTFGLPRKVSHEKFKTIERVLTNGDKKPSAQEVARYANKWATGSVYSSARQVFNSNWDVLSNVRPRWDTHKHTARSMRYTTGSSSDSGPQEFQTVNHIQHVSTSFAHSAGNLGSAIDSTLHSIDALVGTINQLHDAAKSKNMSEVKRLEKRIHSMNKAMYDANFTAAYDIDPFSPWAIVLWTTLGLAGGALFGAGVDAVTNSLVNRGYDRRVNVSYWPGRRSW